MCRRRPEITHRTHILAHLQVLSRYIARRRSLKGKVVLELGSGTGLVGLVAGHLGADVCITDQPCVGFFCIQDTPRSQRLDPCSISCAATSRSTRFRDASRSRNSTGHAPSCSATAHRSFSVLLGRGEPLPEDLPCPDLVLAADCVYFEPAFPLLVQTLEEITTRGSPEILFCYKKRRKVCFLALSTRTFTQVRTRLIRDSSRYSRRSSSGKRSVCLPRVLGDAYSSLR